MTNHSPEIRKLSSFAAERLFCIPQDQQLGPASALTTLRRAAEMIASAISLAEDEIENLPLADPSHVEKAAVAAAGLAAVHEALFGMINQAIAAE